MTANQEILDLINRRTDGGGGDGGATSESLKTSIDDFTALLINPNLQFHDVTTRRRPNETRSHIRIALVERPDVPRVVVVVHHSLVVHPPEAAAASGRGAPETSAEARGCYMPQHLWIYFR